MRPRLVMGRVTHHVVNVPSHGGAERQNPLGYFTDAAPDVSFGPPSMRCASSGPSSDGLVAEDQLTCGAFDSSYGCALARRGIAPSRTEKFAGDDDGANLSPRP